MVELSTVDQQAKALVTQVSEATGSASNEFGLHLALEKHLGSTCRALGITWLPFNVNVSLRTNKPNRHRFADAVHGAVIIEYKTPNGFRGIEGRLLQIAKDEARDYAKLMGSLEGRDVGEYVLVAWDGAHICFGKPEHGTESWETLVPFDDIQAIRLIRYLQDNGRPLVHPEILSQMVGPESQAGTTLIPALYNALVEATAVGSPTTRTKLLFTEWHRLFGQVIGQQSIRLQRLIETQERTHRIHYQEHVPQYIMALSTHIALVAKLIAALSLPNAATNVSDTATQLRTRLENLEDGSIFQDAGIVNILSGDFFGWYLDEVYWDKLSQSIESTMTTLQHLDFDIERKNPSSVRDLFKGMYETFMPKALRHAMGEYYTPDWLASHALDKIGWTPQDQLLDPTCGTGTFLLEAIKRRIVVQAERDEPPDTGALLNGIYGIDLNPLAVLAARASIIVFLSPYITPERPVTVPVWLADAINSPTKTNDYFEHELLTEKGVKSFRVPASMVESENFYSLFLRIKDLINDDVEAATICEITRAEFDLDYLTHKGNTAFAETVKNLAELHVENWDGIWCSILADRFTAGTIPKVSHIAGNPPWVKWSHLPPEYANFIKDKCRRNGVFSDDRWFGGIEADISTIITFEALRKWLQPQGKLSFFITGSVFSNESSQGFRRMRYGDEQVASFQCVEDFRAISPFEDAANHPTLMTLQNGKRTTYPVGYRTWGFVDKRRNRKKKFESWANFNEAAIPTDLLAQPVYGTDEGPWLKGTALQHQQWPPMFNTEKDKPSYRARKGVCTDRNGIFFVEVNKNRVEGTCSITNNPKLGRNPNIQPVKRATVEAEHVFHC